MNPQSTPITDESLDRLVDGELTRAGYSQLLTTLDQEPDGWRRCALAFLESQAFREECGQWAAGSGQNEVVSPSPAKELPTPSDKSSGHGPWATGRSLVLATVASFLVAFLLGTGWQRWSVTPTVAKPPDESRPALPPETAVARDAPQLQRPAANVTFVVDGQRQQTVETPLLEPHEVTPSYLDGDDMIPADLRQALGRLGQDVRRVRHWVPVQLNDGRRAMIPVDEVEIRPMLDRLSQ